MSDPDIIFLREAARYFECRPTGNEDRAHWANVYNAENCRRIADRLAIADTHPKDGDGTAPLVSGGGAQSAIAHPSPSPIGKDKP
jgi:hypothetical protein